MIKIKVAIVAMSLITCVAASSSAQAGEALNTTQYTVEFAKLNGIPSERLLPPFHYREAQYKNTTNTVIDGKSQIQEITLKKEILTNSRSRTVTKETFTINKQEIGAKPEEILYDEHGNAIATSSENGEAKLTIISGSNLKAGTLHTGDKWTFEFNMTVKRKGVDPITTPTQKLTFEVLGFEEIDNHPCVIIQQSTSESDVRIQAVDINSGVMVQALSKSVAPRVTVNASLNLISVK